MFQKALLLFSFTLLLTAQTYGECDNPSADRLLCEDFEYGNGEWETWFAHSDFLGGAGSEDRGRVTLSSQYAHSGTWAAYMPASPGSGYRGASLDWRACDGEQKVGCSMRGFDSLYFRVWIRFAEDHRYVHHFLNIGGSQPDDYWYHGTAGCLPNGELSMGTTVDFKKDSHISHFYTYSPDMRCDTRCDRYMDVDKNCEDCAKKGLPTCTEQKQCCWGNHYTPETPFAFPVGEWFCFEMMMIANTPGEHDGAMAYWVNDSLIHRVDTMMWRTSPTLALNRVRVQHYITASDAQQHRNRVWFDNVVVSRRKIGMKATPTGYTRPVATIPDRSVIVRMFPNHKTVYCIETPRPGPFTLRAYDSQGRHIWHYKGISNGETVEIERSTEHPPVGFRYIIIEQSGSIFYIKVTTIPIF